MRGWEGRREGARQGERARSHAAGRERESRLQGLGCRVQDSGCRVQDSGFRVQDWGGTVVVHEQDAGEGGVEGCPVPRVPQLFREGSYLRLIDFCITQL